MTVERTQQIEFIRSDLIGPSRNRFDQYDHYFLEDKIEFGPNGSFFYPDSLPGKGLPVFWRPDEQTPWQEIVHFKGESPLNKYGAGLLYPGRLRSDITLTQGLDIPADESDEVSLVDEVTNKVVDLEDDDLSDPSRNTVPDKETPDSTDDNDFDVTSEDVYKPSTLGISFCLSGNAGELTITLPESKHFFWQQFDDEPFQVNGGYQKCEKETNDGGKRASYPAWRRIPVTNKDSFVSVSVSEFINGKKLALEIPLLANSPIKLRAELFPRKIHDRWLVTVIVRNVNDSRNLNSNEKLIAHTLFQSYFEVSVKGNSFSRYPEGTRPFEQYDEDEKTLALLYRDSAIWAIGHGCAAGWDAQLGETPDILFADIMPATELPSMTPDIKDKNGNDVSLSMFALSDLPEYDPDNNGWHSLDNLSALYADWIADKRDESETIDKRFSNIANSHLEACHRCQQRIQKGISLLKTNKQALEAFKLANKSMLLQQIASKKLDKRSLHWNGSFVEPEIAKEAAHNPYQMLKDGNFKGVGAWRAFQIAFLLMSIEGIVDEETSPDREVVDLIWFPTGGGKTEAYLGVAAFYMFYQRLLMVNGASTPARDGTNVFMRYTLRMLTTQQFQRAASLICAMEYLRTQEPLHDLGKTRFSLGLWIGGDGTPNKCKDANTALNKYKKGDIHGNPLVLTECPWCKSEIGMLRAKPPKVPQNQWMEKCLAGFGFENGKEPVLKCSDTACHYGDEYASLPIEVIDERIYRAPPSMFIATADKFAMMAYKPEAGALFGRKHLKNDASVQVKLPPGLIIQDEFHLISGPLGTMYGAYEGIFEELCSIYTDSGSTIKPKIIASTATIRGSSEQVKAIYARDSVQLFPSPALLMKDSFFGQYATENDGEKLRSGRLYLGIHAHGYGSFLTTQVRLFTAALFRSYFFQDSKKDPWWTLLAFYNSIRELGGARTLFSSDIYSRLKNYFYRYGIDSKKTRYLEKVEELTSRKTQAELVQMMERLSTEWNKKNSLDACLSSNIIEVGVDIDRLSLMAVVGQPKSTAQYIQVTGRVGRKWWERPGLILAMFNPAKSRDRSHFEQFHSYHRRLYERVEPTSATPYSIEAIERATAGVLLLWARQFYSAESPAGQINKYTHSLQKGKDILISRCRKVIGNDTDLKRSLETIEKVYERLLKKWEDNPQKWQDYPQKTDVEYLMLWPGQFASETQRQKGEVIPSSMRSVDGSASLNITQLFYSEQNKEGSNNE